MTNKSRDLKEFHAQFDRKQQIRTRIQQALSDLLKAGKEEWRSERELCALARVGTRDIPEYRKEFEKHLVRVPSANRRVSKTIWFADPKVAAKVRQ